MPTASSEIEGQCGLNFVRKSSIAVGGRVDASWECVRGTTAVLL